MMQEDAFIHKYLKHHTGQNQVILDLGCGPGRFRQSVRGRYIGLDVTANDYKKGWARAVNVIASARFLPFKESEFNFIFSVASFYLFPGPVLCLQDIHRCLKPGGRFVCFDYTRKTLERFVRAYYETNVPYHSIWTGSQLARLFKTAGFDDVHWWVPDVRTSWKSKFVHLASAVYRHFHDLREGWWVVEGQKFY